MNKISRILFSFLVSATFIDTSLNAQSSIGGQDLRAITTAVPFLTISPDARAGALGDAGVASYSDNPNAIHWNMSSLAFSEKKGGVSLSYTPWLREIVPDINLSYLSGYYNLGEKGGVVAASLRYFSLGSIDFTDEDGISQGTFNANEFAIDGGYTRKVTNNLSAAVALRFIYSNLGVSTAFNTSPAASFAGDLSVRYTKDFELASRAMNISWGVNISNLGAKVSYTDASRKDFIPANLRLGAGLTGEIDEYNKLTLLLDFNKLLVPSLPGQFDKTVLDGIFSSFGDAPDGFSEEISEINLSTGLEYWYNNLIAVRAGFFYEAPEKGNRQYLTFGAGVNFRNFGLDVAYLAPLTQQHPLQNTLRFTLSYAFASGS